MRKISIALLSIAAAACTPNDVTIGGAFKHDIALQTIDPEPTYAGREMEGGSGTHAAGAAERYRKGTVKEPVTIQTTTGGTGTGAAGGSPR